MDSTATPFHEPRPVLEIFTLAKLQLLWTHLNNGNTGTRYVLGLRKRDGMPGYFRMKKLNVERGIMWALATVTRKQPEEKNVAFVPYSFNERHESVWAAFDFDAHDGDWPRAREFAERATVALQRYGFNVLAEASGGGFHVWAIATKPRKVTVWRGLLEEIANRIGAPVADGICELFPVLPRRVDSLGKGMRAPGSWNPKGGDFSKIVAADCEELLNFLSGKSSGFFSVTFPKEKQNTLFFSSSSGEGGASVQWALKEFGIVRPSQRHAQLRALVGYFFNQVGREIGRAFASEQFRRKSVTTRASQAEHLEEFTALWAGLERIWSSELSEAEHAAIDLLATQNERDAFRIVRSYARKAAAEGRPDFPIARDNLAYRLGITPQGAGWLRAKFSKPSVGILERMAPAIANVACARYRWLLAADGVADDPF